MTFHKGDKNPNWTGDNVSYIGVHHWVRRNKPKPDFCEVCYTKSGYDWANISGKYLRDFKDWEYLCRICHMKSDGRLNIIGRYDKHGMNHPLYGKHHSEETKEKMKLSALKRWNHDR